MFSVSAAAVAWYSSNFREYQRQIALVESLGLTQGYVYEGDHYTFGADHGGAAPAAQQGKSQWYEVWNWDWEQHLYLKRVRWVGFAAADQNDLKKISDLPSLEILVISLDSDVKDLNSITRPMPNCRTLRVGGYASQSIESLDGLHNFPSLENLDLFSQHDLDDLGPLVECQKLVSVKNDSPFSAASSLSTIGQLKHLETLELHSDDIEDLEFLRGLDRVKNVNFSQCKNLCDIVALSDAKELTGVDFSGCRSIETIEALANCHLLESLNIANCKRVKALPNFSESKSQVNLQFYNCPNLTNLDGMPPNLELTYLSVTGCRSLTSLDLRQFPMIESLTVVGANELTEIIGLDASDDVQATSKLKGIAISDCQKLENVDWISNPGIVDSLTIDIKMPTELLPHMESLKTLSLQWSDTLTKIAQLPNADSLNALTLRDCRKLQGLRGINKFPNLQALSIVNSPLLVDLDPISDLTNLITLHLTGCETFNNIEGLHERLSLSSIILIDCPSLEDVSPLSRMTELSSLTLNRCTSIRNLEFLEQISSLDALDVSGCSGLRSLKGLMGQPVIDLKLDLANVESVGRLVLPEIYSLSFSNFPDRVLSLFDEAPRHVGAISVKNSPKLKMIQVNANGELQITLDACPNFESIKGARGNLNLTLENFKEPFDLKTVLAGHNIESLTLKDLGAELDLSCLGQLDLLKMLRIVNCPQAHNLKLSPDCELHTLEVSHCERLTTPIDLARHEILLSLTMTDGFAEANISQLKAISETDDDDGSRSEIWNLIIGDCSSPLLANIDFLSGLNGLSFLQLENCDALTTVRSAKTFRDLENLHVIDCDSLVEIGDCKTMPKLINFVIDFCDELSDISAVANMKPLDHLSFEKNAAIKDISPVLEFPLDQLNSLCMVADLDSQLSVLLDRPEVRELSQIYCGGIESAQTLSKIRLTYELEYLTLSDSPAIKDFQFLLNRREKDRLMGLTVKGCPNLRDISQLRQLSISRLEISDCPLISDSQIAEVLKK